MRDGEGQSDGVASERDLQHRPFRAWALQQDLNALLGGDPEWQGESEQPQPREHKRDPDELVRGQAYLREELTSNPEFDLRTKTSIGLWLAALITDCLNQWGPTGLRMDSNYFAITVISVVVALLLTAIVYPQLSPRSFPFVEQTMLAAAFGLIAFQASVTGGADSPYSVWLIFAVFYAGYFMPRQQVFWNTALGVAIALAPLVYDKANTTTNAALFANLLATICVAIAYTTMYRRRLSRRAERAVRFLAVADPLTNVANLRAFESFAEQLTTQTPGTFGLAMVDMNGLKGANTVFGYDVGDDMVARLARLMMDVSGPDDQVARIGGDEFAVLLPRGGERDAAAWYERFVDAVSAHNERVRGRLPQISVSIGTAVFPADGRGTEDLLDAADRRMLKQKTPAVQPPYVIDEAKPISATRMLRDARQLIAPKRAFGRKEFGTQAAAFWMLSAVFVLTWTTLPGAYIPHPAASVALGFYCLFIAATAYAGRIRGLRTIAWWTADIATLTIALPGMYLTGGWRSPFQLFGVLVVAYYAQYYRGVEAAIRVGIVIGTYTLAFWTTGKVSPAGESMFATIVTAELVIAAALQMNARAIDRSLGVLRDSATHDALTGLHNLLAFRDDLARVTGSNKPLVGPGENDLPALILADIDDFKQINDLAGHRGGDAVLREAVRRLETATSRNATLYRIGGDEFAVLFSVDRFGDASTMAERCRRALDFTPPDHVAYDGKVRASVGYSVLSGGMSPEAFVTAVETALAESKSSRGDSVSAGTNLML
ncbi:MAG: diguanylate cyclase domain-containing protein [Solirubrobacterales bacterium]